ncbi:hypothetical protein RBH29_12825 [Herbivorax sp. ANBcel31]|uniref:hypothetical protein n=1 Tax=Herbivorax sp. ANBcel31 TaxID=3069754 RepID=UPI0027B83892|nr:hypothetical protein [Herbivorax sp. ANBcel31]MDQ2087309.1 hypothetical protein [Herbivorax sp. ANBcel31]
MINLIFLLFFISLIILAFGINLKSTSFFNNWIFHKLSRWVIVGYAFLLIFSVVLFHVIYYMNINKTNLNIEDTLVNSTDKYLDNAINEELLQVHNTWKFELDDDILTLDRDGVWLQIEKIYLQRLENLSGEIEIVHCAPKYIFGDIDCTEIKDPIHVNYENNTLKILKQEKRHNITISNVDKNFAISQFSSNSSNFNKDYVFDNYKNFICIYIPEDIEIDFASNFASNNMKLLKEGFVYAPYPIKSN